MLHSTSLCIMKEISGFVCRNLQQIVSETSENRGCVLSGGGGGADLKLSPDPPWVNLKVRNRQWAGTVWDSQNRIKMSYKVSCKARDWKHLAHGDNSRCPIPSLCLHRDICVEHMSWTLLFWMSTWKEKGRERRREFSTPHQPEGLPINHKIWTMCRPRPRSCCGHWSLEQKQSCLSSFPHSQSPQRSYSAEKRRPPGDSRC